jgi:hypothetical protein
VIDNSHGLLLQGLLSYELLAIPAAVAAGWYIAKSAGIL